MNPLQGIPNPFLNSIVPTPWAKFVDVTSIRKSTFETCEKAVDYVRTNSTSVGVLIQGDSGSGKTHMLGRLRKQLQCQDGVIELDTPQQAFVWIRLNTNPRWIWRHVQTNLVDALLKSMPDDLTQLEHLLARRIADYDNAKGDLAKWWEFMREDRPHDLNDYLDRLAGECGASHELLLVLEQWVRRQRRGLCRSWLLGESLPEARLGDLGLCNTPLEDHESLEKHAHDVVLALCKLASSTMSITLCFDQIEALQVNFSDGEGLKEFGDLIKDLHDATNHLAIITCIQSEYFADVREKIPGYAQDAMKSFNTCSLASLNQCEAAELVLARLSVNHQIAQARPVDADELWPLSEQDLKNWTGIEGCSPRKMINLCASRFREIQDGLAPPKVSLDVALRSVWEERQAACEETNLPTQTEQILADGLPILMELALPDWKIVDDLRTPKLEFVLEAPKKEARIGLSFCTDQNMTSLFNRLTRVQKRLAHGDLQKLVLIRDAHTPITKGAVRTRERIAELTEQGSGVLVKPTREVMAALDALRGLFGDAQSGDLAVDGEPVSPESLKEWMLKHLANPLRELCEELTSYHGVIIDPHEALKDELIELIQAEHVIDLSKAAASLNCTEDQLVNLIDSNDANVRLIRGKLSVLYQTIGS